MKTFSFIIQNDSVGSSLTAPRQPKGVCRKGIFY